MTRLTNEKVPYFNAPIYLQNKTQIGKVEEIFGPINEAVSSNHLGFSACLSYYLYLLIFITWFASRGFFGFSTSILWVCLHFGVPTVFFCKDDGGHNCYLIYYWRQVLC